MGLTQQQVQERINQGLTNETDLSTDKTTKEIIISNTFTYFNLIFLIITVLLCLVGSFRNLTFLPLGGADRHRQYTDWNYTGDPREADTGQDESAECTACHCRAGRREAED